MLSSCFFFPVFWGLKTVFHTYTAFFATCVLGLRFLFRGSGMFNLEIQPTSVMCFLFFFSSSVTAAR